MHTLMVLYPQPADPAAFLSYYENNHLPLARKLPGVRAMRCGTNLVSAGDEPPYVLVFEADFDSVEAMGAALGSAEGQAAQADIANFATAGVEIRHFAVQPV